MTHRTILPIRNGGSQPLRVAVEPWANEYLLPPGERLEVIATAPESMPTFEIEWTEHVMVVYVEGTGALYGIRKDGVDIN